MLRPLLLRKKLLKETLKIINSYNVVRNIAKYFAHPQYRNPAFLCLPNNKFLYFQNCRNYADYPPHKKITLPALSPTMDEGKIASWKRKEGDKVSEGDLLGEVETDKATMDFDSPEDGIIAKIVIPVGGTCPVGALVIIFVDKAEDIGAFKDYKAEAPAASTAATPAPATAPSVAPTPQVPPPVPAAAAPTSPTAAGDRVYASPLAKQLAAEKNIVLHGKGTGLYDSITSKDLDKMGAAPSIAAGKPASGIGDRVHNSPLAQRFTDERILRLQGKAAPAPGISYVDIPVSSMRNTIAKRLLESKLTIPHFYITVDVNVDNLLKIRAKLNKKLAKKGVKISLNDFIIKATAMAALKVPQANSSWMGSSIRRYHNVDVSVAVTTSKGLFTPIIFGAHVKGIIEISKNMKDLAFKAKSGTLQPKEFQGGTITVSNLGMFGVTSFSAIVNPPQAAIIAIGNTRQQLIADTESTKGFREVNIMSATLSGDHRVLDGAAGAEWAVAFRECLEDPVNMII